MRDRRRPRRQRRLRRRLGACRRDRLPARDRRQRAVGPAGAALDLVGVAPGTAPGRGASGRRRATAPALCAQIDEQFERLCAVVRSLAVLREVAPRSLDAVAALGEILSSRIVAAALAARGCPPSGSIPSALILTDNSFTAGAAADARDASRA